MFIVPILFIALIIYLIVVLIKRAVSPNQEPPTKKVSILCHGQKQEWTILHNQTEQQLVDSLNNQPKRIYHVIPKAKVL